jgi:hypothetical protein
MGIWFSLPTENKENQISVKVLPESIKTESEKIPLRHRPTCLSTDIEQGITEIQENARVYDTKSA